MCDRNDKKLCELVNLPGNNLCADCNSEGVEYGSFNLGVFLCTACATYHQKMGTHISKVKSLKLAKWNDDQAQAMETLGNIEGKKKYEMLVPVFYRRPKQGDPPILLEQWIRAKYERLEFIHEDRQKYCKTLLEDTLLIKRRNDSTFSSKVFVLSEENKTLSVFSKEDSKDPKISVELSKLNASLSPTKMNLENSLQLSFIDDGCTHHLFVAHERAEIIIDWYMAIRRCKLNGLMIAYPAVNPNELIQYLTNDFAMEGWVSKTGPSENDAYRKRWLTLDDRKLMYHINPMDEFPRGEVFLGHISEKYEVKEGAPAGCKAVGFVFSLVTPERTFVFSVATEQERQGWIHVINKVLETPLRPQEIQSRTLLDPNKKRTSRHSWFHF